MRFLVDENLPVGVSESLRDHGHDVLHLAHSGHRGAAAQEERIIVTRDLDFPMPDSPRPPGVVLVRVPDVFTGRQIARVISEFAASTALEQAIGAITVVSPGRVRVRRL